MEKTLKKQNITIFDDEYTIVSDESDDVLNHAVSYVNEMMKAISIQANIIDKKKVAVLTSLRMALKIRQLEDEFKDMQEKEHELINSMQAQLESLDLSS